MTQLHRAAAAAALLMVSACAENPTAPVIAAPGADQALAEPQFLACPTEAAVSATGTIGILGGTLAVDGHRFSLPPLAVLQPTTFTMTAPASQFVELEIHADGKDSFDFLLPARISISYDRCQRPDIDHASLHVWHIDNVTGALLELMGGLADPDTGAVNFTSGHLSGFIIAN